VIGYFPRSSAISRDWVVTTNYGIAILIQPRRSRIASSSSSRREKSNDRQHISEFRERGAETLKTQRRDPDDEDDLKIAVARERKIWLNDVLTK